MKTRNAHIVVSSLLLMCTGGVYLSTVAPTIAFWDSAEFATAAHTMGIPHPPGAPLLTLAGRVMMLLPWYDFRGGGTAHPAFRVNLLAAICAALAVMLVYLVTVALVRRFRAWTGDVRTDWPVLFGGVMAAWLAAFSHQFWDNAVEFETYMPSLLLSLFAIRLTLCWEERKEHPGAVRYLLLAAYVIGLGNAVHLSTLLAAPAVAGIVILARPDVFRDVRIWAVLAAAVLVLGGIRFAGGRMVLYGAAVVLGLVGPFVVHRLYARTPHRRRSLLYGITGAILCFVIGWSVYPTIMIRAGKDPALNQGDPSSWERFDEYLARRQYVQENMYAGMFDRKAPFSYQFGFMYARYLLDQLPSWGPSPALTFTSDRPGDIPDSRTGVRESARAPLLLLLLAAAGVLFHVYRDPRRFWPLFLYFLLTSAGLVLYLNMENPQARDRGYFFLGSFMVIMIWIGIGVAGLLEKLRTAVAAAKPGIATPVTAGAALLVATVMPAALLSDHLEPGVSNYRVHDRSGNYIPLDYGFNMLQSCEPDGILFTRGDNDTYPLWYAQHVMGVRPDIRVVNLSLTNGPWYVKQLRDREPKVPIGMSDDFIEGVIGGESLRSQVARRWTPHPQEVTAAGITWEMPPTYVMPTSSGERIGILGAPAMVTAHIIGEVNWTRPLYFSVGIDPNAMIGLDDYLSTEGMVFRLVPEKSDGAAYRVNVPKMERLLFDEYRFRGLADSTLYIREETRQMLGNYAIAFLDLTDARLRRGEGDRALRTVREAYERLSPAPLHRALLIRSLAEGGMTSAADSLLVLEAGRLPGRIDDALSAASAFRRVGPAEHALRLYEAVTRRFPEAAPAWAGYAETLIAAGRHEQAIGALEHLERLDPGHPALEPLKRRAE